MAGAILVACAIWASLSLQSWLMAGIAGAGGLALWRLALAAKPFSPIQIVLDAAAFAIFALLRNDSIGFWQLPGPWVDVPRFDVAGAAIAYVVYVGGSLAALLSRYRGLRASEAVGLVALPFLFGPLAWVLCLRHNKPDGYAEDWFDQKFNGEGWAFVVRAQPPSPHRHEKRT